MAITKISAMTVLSGLTGAEFVPVIVTNGNTFSNARAQVSQFNITGGGSQQSANLVFAGPSSGAPAAPAFRLLVTADIGAGIVSYAKIQNESASTVLGNPTGAPAAPSEVTLGSTLAFVSTALQTTAMTGDVTASANSFATTIAANAVTTGKIAANAVTTAQIAANAATYAKVQQGTGLSVVGVTGNGAANNADIVGTAAQVLRVNDAGTALAFGAIDLAQAAAVTGVLPLANVTLPHVPTLQYLTSGSGATYTTPANCRLIIIKMVGAGGGGEGSSSGAGVAGSAGGDTIFNAIHAAGGGGGGVGQLQQGGLGGTGGTGTANLRLPGTGGWSPAGPMGGHGAPGIFGMGGPRNLVSGGTGAGPSGGANTGAGGSGADDTGTTAHGGGGAGEYAELYIASPAATYTYTVGAGGSGGSGTQNGGTGGSGLIIVEEYY